MTGPATDRYDVEAALRQLARQRRNRDPLIRETTHHADRLAEHLRPEFGPEAEETAGLALVRAAASLGGLAAELASPDNMEARNLASTLVNLLAFAGQRMVSDSRLADGPGGDQS